MLGLVALPSQARHEATIDAKGDGDFFDDDDLIAEFEKDVTSEKQDWWDWIIGNNKIIHTMKRRVAASEFKVLDPSSWCQAEKKSKEDDMENGSHPVLEGDARENADPDSMVIHCGCCADHLVGDAPARAALVYGSKKAYADAFYRDNTGHTAPVGVIPVWTVGSRTPAILCDRGMLVCHCEDPSKDWVEHEKSCERGLPCTPPPFIRERNSLPKDTAQPAAEMDGDAPLCARYSTEDKKSGNERAPIGSTFCEDMDSEACAHVYSRSDSGMHHICQLDTRTPRHCGARPISIKDIQEEMQTEESFAIQHFYCPKDTWEIQTENFVTKQLKIHSLHQMSSRQQSSGVWPIKKSLQRMPLAQQLRRKRFQEHPHRRQLLRECKLR